MTEKGTNARAYEKIQYTQKKVQERLPHGSSTI